MPSVIGGYSPCKQSSNRIWSFSSFTGLAAGAAAFFETVNRFLDRFAVEQCPQMLAFKSWMSNASGVS